MIALLLACAAAPKDSSAVDVPDTGAPTEDTAPLVEPAWTADEAAQALTDTVGLGLPEAATLRSWFLALLVAEAVPDPGCYIIEESDAGNATSSVWDGTCTGASGYQFDGLWLYQETRIEDGDMDAVQASLLASFQGVATDGSRDVIGGTLTIERSEPQPGQVTFKQSSGGLWRASREPGWLGEGVGLGLDMNGTVIDGKVALEVEGGAAYDDGGYLYFRDMSFDEVTCGRAPMGELWIRDPSTAWIVFDFGTDCDACAAVSVAGEDWGEQCVGDAVWVAAANAVQSLAIED